MNIEKLLEHLKSNRHLALAATEHGGWEILDLIGLQERSTNMSYYSSYAAGTTADDLRSVLADPKDES